MTTLLASLGGPEGCYRLAQSFYARVATDPALRPFFPNPKNLRCATEAFAAFLVQFLGGPAEHTQHRWFLSLRESHHRFAIGAADRAAWMSHMTAALAEPQIPPGVRAQLERLFEQASAYLVNQGPAPVAPAGRLGDELAWRWAAQQKIDAAVAAARAGDAAGALAHVQDLTVLNWFEQDRAVHAAFLAVLISGSHADLTAYAANAIAKDPELARVRYSRRTLLHAAAGAGNHAVVDLLLRMGADPNVLDDGGHAPLYAAANECTPGAGADVIGTLIAAGAHVNASDGAKRCTALHMAARRGNLAVAEALLRHGADLEARDTLGDTPLRRAVNCNQPHVAAFLFAKGANALSIGNKGLTPQQAARTKSMRVALGLTAPTPPV